MFNRPKLPPTDSAVTDKKPFVLTNSLTQGHDLKEWMKEVTIDIGYLRGLTAEERFKKVLDYAKANEIESYLDDFKKKINAGVDSYLNQYKYYVYSAVHKEIANNIQSEIVLATRVWQLIDCLYCSWIKLTPLESRTLLPITERLLEEACVEISKAAAISALKSACEIKRPLK